MEKKKKNIVLSIIIISIIVLAIAGFAIYKLLSNKPKNVYFATIDQFAEIMTKAIDETTKGGKKETLNLSFDIKTSNQELRKIATILNKLDLKLDVEADFSKKVLNMGVNALYNKGSMLNGSFYVSNKTAFIDSKDLLDKPIKFPEMDELGEIWDSYSSNEMKTVINEMKEILKRSLKDEYFKVSEEKIKINGADVTVSKEVLELKDKDLENVTKDMLDGMINNDKLLNALSKMSKVDKNDIRKSIEESKKEIKDVKGSIYVELLINKTNNELEGALIGFDGGEIKLVKKSENILDIIISSEGNELTIGTLELTNEIMDLNIELEGNKINYRISAKDEKNYDMLFVVNTNELNVNLSLNHKEDKINGEFNIKIGKDNYIVKFDGSIIDNYKVDAKTFKDFNELEKMSESDMQLIYEKIGKNQNLINFVQDLNSINSSLTF